MRAVQWLEQKKIVVLTTTTEQVVALGPFGCQYVKDKLPEVRFLQTLLTQSPLSFSALQQQAHLSSDEMSISLGLLKRLGAIGTKQEQKELQILLTSHGRELFAKGFAQQHLLEKVASNSRYEIYTSAEKALFAELQKRKGLVTLEERKLWSVSLTSLGQQLQKTKLTDVQLEALTPQMLKEGSWQHKSFRAYDLNAPVPPLTGGRRHFVAQSISAIKRIWLDLGFSEMQGSFVQTAFWDLDALFVPQDHPAREMQDTFYVADTNGKVLQGTLPSLATTIKMVHEMGGKTGSLGWRAPWKASEAQKVLLRTHTTVLSAQTIARLKKEDLPAKFFSVHRVFRNEALDWKHLFEFYQVEGIVVDPNANFSHLLGYLQEFYKKMGYTKIRISPSYFPYTSFSCEVAVYVPEKKQWLELGGAGIFRPEVVEPLLGFACPVLAWGQGMERSLLQYYMFSDIRNLYDNDLATLKTVKEWVIL